MVVYSSGSPREGGGEALTGSELHGSFPPLIRPACSVSTSLALILSLHIVACGSFAVVLHGSRLFTAAHESMLNSGAVVGLELEFLSSL